MDDSWESLFKEAGEIAWSKMQASVQFAVGQMTPKQRAAFWAGLLGAVSASAAADTAAVVREARTAAGRLIDTAETLGWLAERFSALPEARGGAAGEALLCAMVQETAARLAQRLVVGEDPYDALSEVAAFEARAQGAKVDLLRAVVIHGAREGRRA